MNEDFFGSMSKEQLENLLVIIQNKIKEKSTPTTVKKKRGRPPKKKEPVVATPKKKEDFRVNKSSKAKKESVSFKENTFIDDGSCRDENDGKIVYKKTEATRPKYEPQIVVCDSCKREYKVPFKAGTYYRCERCVGR